MRITWLLDWQPGAESRDDGQRGTQGNAVLDKGGIPEICGPQVMDSDSFHIRRFRSPVHLVVQVGFCDLEHPFITVIQFHMDKAFEPERRKGI